MSAIGEYRALKRAINDRERRVELERDEICDLNRQASEAISKVRMHLAVIRQLRQEIEALKDQAAQAWSEAKDG